MIAETIYDRMDSGDVVLIVVPVSSSEADDLVDKLHTSGYNTIPVKDMSDLFRAAGYEQAELAEPADLKAYDELTHSIEHIMHAWTDSKNADKGTVRLLGYIALALTDIAKTLKQHAPPAV